MQDPRQIVKSFSHRQQARRIACDDFRIPQSRSGLNSSSASRPISGESTGRVGRGTIEVTRGATAVRKQTMSRAATNVLGVILKRSETHTYTRFPFSRVSASRDSGRVRSHARTSHAHSTDLRKNTKTRKKKTRAGVRFGRHLSRARHLPFRDAFSFFSTPEI